VFSLLAGAIDPSGYPAMLRAELARLNRGGLTTCSEMAFDPVFRPVLEQMHNALTVRLRPYEISNAQMSTDMTPDNGDDMLRQIGIKIWVDGAIRPEQLVRAHDLGVTCSLFVDQIHYWGDVIVDGLFGPEHGERWMPCGSAVKTGMRISLHNDPPVTPEEPLRNISVAVTRTAPSGRVLAPGERLTVEQAIRAQTVDAAWQLFADDVVGSLEVGKYADMVVLSADPRTVPPEKIADLEVRATFLAGRQVYPKGD
jgi:predicted amidohydrolase YtcJ